MTRVTNFGIKRTYVRAGFAEDDATHHVAPTTSQPATTLETNTNQNQNVLSTDSTNPSVPPLKKKRKRTPKSKRDGYAAQKAAEAAKLNGEEVIPSETQPVSESQTTTTLESNGEPPLTRLEKKQKRNLARRNKVLSATEGRRLKRIAMKNADTTCYACREKGHAARDCPSHNGDENAESSGKGTPPVGVCNRCNSKKHNLSRCKKPANPADPFPYASCFVCNGKGHLASACPSNKAKGVYPNGGCCKLCGDTSHLARDCGIREKVTDPTTVLGTGREAGPDEDDFHMFKRHTIEIERVEKKESQLKEMLDIRTGALSGSIKPTGHIPQPKKKIVVFQ